jgi:hypothetical protein
MQTMKTTRIALVLILIAMGANAQEYTFRVLANKGTNELKAGEEWAPLKTGASLKSGDELKLSENAYVGLVHATGKPLEVKKAGNYKVADLASQVSPGSGVVAKYTDFILSSNSAGAKKDRLSATGAVSRGDSYAIKLMLPDNQYAGIYNNAATISWDGSVVSGPYTVTLRNMFDDELNKFDTPETNFKIDLTEPRYAKESAILIEVRSKADPKQVSKQHLIKRLSPAEQSNVKKLLVDVDKDLAGEITTPVGQYILAGFYEENNLLIDAVTAYEEAIKLAPDVPTYQESYEEFLFRHNMK